MKKEFLEVGKFVGTHGVRGMVRIQPWSDDGEFFLIGYTNGIVEMFSTANGTFMKKLENNHSKRITAMNWSSLTMNLITGSEGGKIVGWNGWNSDSQISMIDDDEKVDWEWD